MAIKQQHESDLDDPKQRFPWAFRGVGYNGSPMAIAEPILEEWSEHLSKAGFIHISQVGKALDSTGLGKELLQILPKQEIHYQPPVQGQDHSMNLSGQWQSVEEPVMRSRVSVASLFTPAEKAQLIAEFREEGILD